jgi:pimeloyl-ACP methyl ester carboxylesterase
MPEISTSVSSKVHYRKYGSGPAMVLIHGFPEDGGLWDRITDALSRSFTVLIPDLPGSGGSVLEQETSIVQMASVIKEILDQEQILAAVLAGHSMGGYVALAFARLYPDCVSGISLVHSMPVADDEEKKKMRLKSTQLIRNGGREVFLNQMVPNLFSTAFKQNNPEIVSDSIAKALKTNAGSLINYYDAMRLREDSRDVVQSAAFPFQWIMGLHDNVMDYKKILIEVHRSAINFVTFYHDSGHMSMVEQLGDLAADLNVFGKYCNRIRR